METINGKVHKIYQNPKNFVIKFADGFSLSGFGVAPPELVEGKTYQFSYVVNGQYKNLKGFVESSPDGQEAKVTHETVSFDAVGTASATTKIKTFVCDNAEDMDDKVNAFNAIHNGFATQTNVAVLSGGNMVLVKHIATVFYRL